MTSSISISSTSMGFFTLQKGNQSLELLVFITETMFFQSSITLGDFEAICSGCFSVNTSNTSNTINIQALISHFDYLVEQKKLPFSI